MSEPPVPDDPTPPLAPPAVPLASVSRREKDGVIVASVRGEIDVSNAGQLFGELTKFSNQVCGLVVDLSGVEYLDTAGIALLYELHLRLKRREQSLVVVAPSHRAPRRVLELTAFDTRVALTDELAPALAAVQG